MADKKPVDPKRAREDHLKWGTQQIDNAIKELERANINAARLGIQTSIKLAESRAIYQAMNRIQ